MDDLETVDYNNDTSAIDLVPVWKLKTIKENENDNTEIIKTVQRVVISHDVDDHDVEFSKQMSLHPTDRLERSEKKYLQILPKKVNRKK